MQTGQVSIWVPIVVGVIGLVGVVVGQFVSSWREDRRWLREQQREDVRWQRELERESLSRTFADRTHWRDKKFEIYNDFLTFMKQWRDQNYEVALKLAREGAAPSQELARLHKHDRDSFEHRDRIELIATDRDAQRTLITAIEGYQTYAGKMSIGHLPVDRSELDEFVDENEAAIDFITAAIRVDLGISDDSDRAFLGPVEPPDF